MGKKKFILTEDMIQRANHYIPLKRMVYLAKACAPYCIEKSKIAEQNQKGVEFLALPTLWVDDVETKELYKMSVLLTEYLKIQIPDDFTDEDYDYYASSHVLNQLERYKSNMAIKDKVFDLLGNYKKFEKILNTEIENEKMARNDSVARLSAAISIISSPENIQKMKEELEKTVNEVGEAQKNVRKQIEGKADEA